MLCREADLGVGAVLITEEVLASQASAPFVELLFRQAPWSAIPILAFYSERESLHALQKKAQHPLHKLADVTFLQRPVGGATLFSAIKTAVRDRMRQYDIRDLLNRLHIEVIAKEQYADEQKQARIVSEQRRIAALEASKLKSQFLANMSHEIRTPLGAIMGFLELIKDPSLTREEIEEYVSIVNRNSVQLMRLIDDILDLSKVEAGKMEIETVDFSLAELIFDFAALMNFKAQDKGVLFDVKLAASVPKMISSDPVRLKQVLSNAVGNAIKFTEKGRVQVTCSYADPVLKFTITDTGKGITQDQAEKLFKPFVQADSSMTRNYGGTGLGLVLSKRICQEMGGDFVLESSSLNKGSTFVATLKVDKVADTDPLYAKISAKGTGLTESKILSGLQILLVEDMPDNQVLIRSVLRSMGAEIEIASNGQEGLESIANKEYDIVLMDIQMPFMDGHEATRQLRSQGYAKPIIALTAHAMKEERERALVSGFTDYLTKPVDRTALAYSILKFQSRI